MMTTALQSIARQAAQSNAPVAGDYTGDGGLLYCGKCNTPKQYELMLFGKLRRVSCMCQCRKERESRHNAEKMAEQISAIQERGGISPSCTFETSCRTPEMDKCWRYVERWGEARKKNIGLLLWGRVGTGKTHAAHCVCNALIQKSVAAMYQDPRNASISVFATSLSRVLETGFDKSEVLDRVRRTSLVVFDDLGAERGNDYALETLFTLLDERYRAKKPLIVTSNVRLAEMKNPHDEKGKPDIRRKIIYDRVLEMCVPIGFDRESARPIIADEKRAAMSKFLES